MTNPKLVKDGPENDLRIEDFMHCALCLAERPKDISPRDFAALEVGWTHRGFQVWCRRHECNVIHVDFKGRKFPANFTRKSAS
jgi:hypothetical protein